jgi:hypothetical protein
MTLTLPELKGFCAGMRFRALEKLLHQYRAHAKNCDRVRAFYLLLTNMEVFRCAL